jgi:DNA-binding FadR family transcriptional regulator
MESDSDFGTWSERDTLLHLVIADASGSERVVAQIGRLREEVYQLGQRIPTPRAAAELANREHRELIRAIAARQPERARQAMVHHVQSTRALWLGLGRVPA